MRDTMIRSMDLLAWVFGVVTVLVGVATGLAAMSQGQFLPDLGIIIAAAVLAILSIGMVLLMVGIYDNAKRAADALQRLAARQGN